MEDTFKIIPNINGSDVSIYGIFDGHAGEFAALYACDIILPTIAEKIAEALCEIGVKIQKLKQPPKKEPENTSDSELIESEEEIENKYITADNKINYELLLHEEIIAADQILIERMSKALLFGGTTLCVVLVDISNKLIICANVGDSRAVLCDNRGRAIPLSHDHKPNNLKEMERIRENGGFISNKEGCWRVEGSLATSRSLGDYPLKMKKVIIAEPDIITFRFKDFK
jgi:protein phosphatase 1L